MNSQEPAISAYVIHMPQQRERLQQLEKSMARFPLFKTKVIQAVDGKTVPETERKQSISPLYPLYTGLESMTAGEYGCAMSHRKCYQMLLQSQDKIGLVIEDDVLLAPSTLKAVKTVLPELSGKRPTIVLLSCNLYVWRTAVCHQNGFSLYRVLEGGGAYGYLLNRAAASLILECGLPFRTPCDWWSVPVSFGIRVLAISPHVASYSSSREDSLLEQDRQALWGQSRNRHRSFMDRIGQFWYRHLRAVPRKTLYRLGFVVYLEKTWG